MPLDNLRHVELDVPPQNELTAAGYEPVSEAVVNAHKRIVAQRWQGNTVYFRSPRWETIPLGYRFTYDSLRASNLINRGLSTERPRMPRRLAQLALTVSRLVTQPKLEVEYFGDDPILYLLHGPAYDRFRDCLGVWDRGWFGRSKLVAIAHRKR